MDILELIDKLEDLFNESRSFPFTHNVIVDEDKIFDVLDQMRVSIPDEVKKSKQVINQRERYLAQAQEEANRITALAREKSEHLIDENQIVQAANTRAEQIRAQVIAETEATRRDADNYVIETLQKLELELERTLTQVRNGLRTLQQDKQRSAATSQSQITNFHEDETD